MYDEFRPLPPEDSELPPEFSHNDDEEYNSYAIIHSGSKKKLTEEQQNKRNRKRMVKILARLTASAMVVTGAIAVNPEYKSILAEGKQYEFQLGANAELIDSHTVRLTGLKTQSIGSLWSDEAISFEDDVTVEFDVLQGKNEFGSFGNGTDGLAMGFSDKPNDISDIAGGGLGYNSLFGAELDLFYNPPEETGGRKDYLDDHYAILGDNVWNHLAAGPRVQLDDGEWHHVSVTYSLGELSFYYDGIKKLESDIDVEMSDEGLYLTFSGATGDGMCYQYISNVLINGEEIIIVDSSGEILSEQLVEGEYQFINREDEDPNIEETSYVDDLVEDESDPVDETSDEEPEEESEDESETPKTEIVTCDECNGKGIICPGSLAADDPEGCHGEVIVDCKACNGTGKKDNGDPCSWCKGTLRHLCPSFEEHRTCEKCGGSGQVEVTVE